MSNRTMYDSTSALDIPTSAEVVAGYVNGEFAWSNRSFDRFPKAQHVRIDIFGTDPDRAGILDVENGAATPAHCLAWLQARERHTGKRGTIYCSSSTIPLVRAVVGSFFHYWWIADPTSVEHDYVGNGIRADVTQYQWPGRGSTGHWDKSLISNAEWHKRAAS